MRDPESAPENAYTRRQFVQHSAVASVAGLHATQSWMPGRVPLTCQDNGVDDDRARSSLTSLYRVAEEDMRALALRAIDAARHAGASYADVRLTRVIEQSNYVLPALSPSDQETYGAGVRALVDGAWGFAASPWWEPDEMTRLAREAVLQARENAKGAGRRIELVPAPVVTGSWVMPGIDPFTVTLEERQDFLRTWEVIVGDTPKPSKFSLGVGPTSMEFLRKESMFASTDGSAVHQVTYRSKGMFSMSAVGDGIGFRFFPVPGLHAQGKGWDLFDGAQLREHAREVRDEMVEFFSTPEREFDVGRYDVVADAFTVGAIVGRTIGGSTQLDTALGYEANAGGASMLGQDPLASLGQYQMASPLVTITADRNTVGTPSHVQWDDDGVAPEPITLVDRGVLNDFQTTRDLAGVLAPYYKKGGRPVRSHGCSSTLHALMVPIVQLPHMTLIPGTSTTSFGEMVAGTSRGIAWIKGDSNLSVNSQGTTGTSGGIFREIMNGKLGDRLVGNYLRFKTNELWKNITALGGQRGVKTVGISTVKGEPRQQSIGSVTAVPAVFKNVTFTH